MFFNLWRRKLGGSWMSAGRLRKALEHYYEHTAEHAEKLREYAEMARGEGAAGASQKLELAAELMDRAAEAIRSACMSLSEGPSRVIEAESHEILDIEVEESLLEVNRRIAEENRRLLDERGVYVVEFMGSIGSGKTSLIEALVEKLKERYRIGYVAGDLTTTIDADRVGRHGVPVVQLNTGRECHLDANLFRKALYQLDLNGIDLLLVENVGNLICPADFPLGSHRKVVVVSVTEGEHMVRKHPIIFKEADVAVINKVDLAEEMGVSPSSLERDAKELNPRIKVVKTSVKTGDGIDELVEALGL